MGIFSKKMGSKAAIAGMLAGIGGTLFYVFQHEGIMFVKETAFLGDMLRNWFFGIDSKAFGSVGAIVNFLVAFLVAKIMAEKIPEQIQHMVGIMIFLVEWVRARLKPHVQSGVCNFWTCSFSRAFFSDILSGCELWVIRNKYASLSTLS